MIRVTSIAKDNLELFSAYMSRQAAAMLKAGMPVLALGALDNETACGGLTGYMESHSSFRINGLFIAPESRRRGAAALLLRALGELLSEEEQIESVKIDYIEFGAQEQGLSALLPAAGFEQKEPDIPFFGAALSALSDADFFKAEDKTDSCVVPFSEMTDYLIRSVDKHFALGGAPILDGPLLGSALERELSAGLSDGKAVPAFVVITNQPPRLHIALLYAEPSYSGKLPSILRFAMRRATDKYPPETVVTMQTVSEKGEAVARRIMEGSSFENLARSAELVFKPVGIFR